MTGTKERVEWKVEIERERELSVMRHRGLGPEVHGVAARGVARVRRSGVQLAIN
jgi:hypothetical protein